MSDSSSTYPTPGDDPARIGSEGNADQEASVAGELVKMGIEAACNDTGLTIKGGKPHGADIETYNDHRMAMSFAVAGLRTPGIVIKDEKCVEKSFPDFWTVFKKLYE